jgi:transglutaminase-like putative cysteine protease
MLINVGYELCYDLPQATPMLLTLHVHHTRASDLVRIDHMKTTPSVPTTAYRDGFGNWCTRLIAPAGAFLLTGDAMVRDSGAADVVAPGAVQHPVPLLPDDTLVFLLGSRYCETDRLSEVAWKLFSGTPLGWDRVQAICDFVHEHLQSGTSTPGRRRPPGMPTTRATGSVATLPIWPSRSAAA